MTWLWTGIERCCCFMDYTVSITATFNDPTPRFNILVSVLLKDTNTFKDCSLSVKYIIDVYLHISQIWPSMPPQVEMCFFLKLLYYIRPDRFTNAQSFLATLEEMAMCSDVRTAGKSHLKRPEQDDMGWTWLSPPDWLQ